MLEHSTAMVVATVATLFKFGFSDDTDDSMTDMIIDICILS